MLEVGKSDSRWLWSAFGKHPVARDYLELGPDHVMAQAFSQWIDQGHHAFVSSGRRAHQSCSWRFWAMTPKKGELAIGLLKDSCDSIGRPFPFLVMGAGRVEGWEDHWELLPLVCEKSWVQMEYIGSRNYKEVELLKADIQALRPPFGAGGEHAASWEEYSLKAASMNFTLPADTKKGIREYIRAYLNDQEAFIPIEAGVDAMGLICLLNKELKEGLDRPPTSLFVGGAGMETFMAVFSRPLRQDDFVKLWSVSAQGA